MLSNLDDTSFIPLTITYIEDTSDTVAQNYSIKSWLERFRFDHEYLYKSSLPSLSGTYSLPRPFVLLVDDHHETPLNNTLVQFFNNETFKEVHSCTDNFFTIQFCLVYRTNLSSNLVKRRLPYITRTF